MWHCAALRSARPLTAMGWKALDLMEGLSGIPRLAVWLAAPGAAPWDGLPSPVSPALARGVRTTHFDSKGACNPST